jgi:nicotinate-nucleotide pyrophosphorylase (carboxylating)
MQTEAEINGEREALLERALFHGASLTLENPEYVRTLHALTEAFLKVDLAPVDVTVEALQIDRAPVEAAIVAREPGVAAGLAELAHLLRGFNVKAAPEKNDGDLIAPGAVLLRARGERAVLLSLERVGLNLVQRMCGIATATGELAARARAAGGRARIVATRKTPWSLLDKRAVHLGGGGTHRLGLSDAILIKNNHLALLAEREDEAVRVALERVWERRGRAAFVEVEVRSEAAALAAAQAFARMRLGEARPYPCLVMLDNMTAGEAARVVGALKRAKLLHAVLLEASGRIDEDNVADYAASGVDAISVGALTHSARALDLSQRI